VHGFSASERMSSYTHVGRIVGCNGDNRQTEEGRQQRRPSRGDEPVDDGRNQQAAAAKAEQGERARGEQIVARPAVELGHQDEREHRKIDGSSSGLLRIKLAVRRYGRGVIQVPALVAVPLDAIEGAREGNHGRQHSKGEAAGQHPIAEGVFTRPTHGPTESCFCLPVGSMTAPLERVDAGAVAAGAVASLSNHSIR
jgi:hypothetical protein